MKTFKQYFEAVNTENIWFHGDPNKRTNFCDQKMDRIPFTQDPNANGPGIYFTKDYPQAKGYAYPDGYIYTVDIDTSGPAVDVELEDTSKPETGEVETAE